MIYNSITIIVPAYKDYRFVKPKIDNLLRLRYPADQIEILFVKGGCKREQVVILHAGAPLIKVINTVDVGKTNQLNAGLKKALGGIILVTDIDSLLPVNTLEEINKEIGRPSVGCVGVFSMPQPAHVLDRIYWSLANWGRYFESRFYTASHVTATCYAFKKMVEDKTEIPFLLYFDVIADDVFIPMLINFRGNRTSILRNITVTESRNPTTVRELVKHKARKGNAFLRELLRFTYQLPEARGKLKLIFLLKLLAFMLVSGWGYMFIQQDSNFEKVR